MTEGVMLAVLFQIFWRSAIIVVPPLVVSTILALVIAITEQLIRDTATPWQIDITAALVLGLCYGAMAQALTQHFRISPRPAPTVDLSI